MKGMVLASHGRLAEGLYDTLTIFYESPQQVKYLCLFPGKDMNEFIEEVKSSIREVDSGDGVVFFCDLLFGTPCNCAARLLNDEEFKGKFSIITGMNLSMVLEYANARTDGMDNERVLEVGKSGIVDFEELMKSRKQ